MTPIDRAELLPHLLARRALETPDRPFARHVSGRTLTYGEFHDGCLRWAAVLGKIGVRPGENVLNLQPNGIEAYQTWIGASWLNAVEVGLNVAYQGRMLTYTASTSNARVMVVSAGLMPRLAAVASELPELETIVVMDADAGTDLPSVPQTVLTGVDLLADVEPASGLNGPDAWDVACIIWTSGTTGPSKGVIVPWGEIHEFCQPWRCSLTPDDVIYNFWPSFHLSGKFLVHQAALNDVPIVLRESFSAGNFWNDVRTFGATFTPVTEPMLRILSLAEPTDRDRDHSLRSVITTPVFPELPAILDRFGIAECGTWYGMSEIGPPLASDGFRIHAVDSCGRVRGGYEVRIVDDNDYPVAPGQTGELIVRSDRPWVMNVGYYGMPDKTAEAWRNGWFHTGDAFRCDEEGNYSFVDRIKDAIRRRGENISSFEVEAYVNEHPDVAECAAIAVPSQFGEDDVKVVVVPVPGRTLTPPALVTWLAQSMPRFMVPRYVEIVDALPKTEGTLRTQKAALRVGALNDRTWDREAAGIELPK